MTKSCTYVSEGMRNKIKSLLVSHWCKHLFVLLLSSFESSFLSSFYHRPIIPSRDVNSFNALRADPHAETSRRRTWGGEAADTCQTTCSSEMGCEVTAIIPWSLTKCEFSERVNSPQIKGALSHVLPLHEIAKAQTLRTILYVPQHFAFVCILTLQPWAQRRTM